MSLVSRKAVWDDVSGIKKVAFDSFYTRHFTHPAYCNRPKFNNGEVIVIANEEQIIGFAVLRIKKQQPETEIDIFGIDIDWRSKGVGSHLLGYICHNQRNPILVLNVHKTNKNAIISVLTEIYAAQKDRISAY